MMKRFCGILAAFALIVSYAAASGEEVFTLHNGTTFGMTMNEVKETELRAGVTVDEPDGGVARLEWKGKIAGQEFAHLTYYFDNEAKLLDELWYSFDYIAGYDTINTGLIKKYGEPDFTEISGECYGWSVGKGFFNKIHSVQVNHTEETAFGNSVYSDADYSQWLITQSDGSSILISHFKFVMNNAKRNIINREEHYVIYELLDAEKTETILNEIQQKSSDL